ncbi:UvrD-helicase domain-containing protein [Ralstonia pseudosolanacearum]|uniref:UvrD-helicase domain-containing protein n=1 Tax=Ralstonia pseudosolanacearum TaxID=1310165 RepID=UPI002676B970|nr:UvrD-helicase domain-containing protein [Ralstonia pseudosolanacearum]MDO3506869.1 UvrD-helicase domain-containing protein [Ralstonia pseudosolanacearum]MDO3512921.1 UvrD-helicase domain-containing protein [Ralstonia pseudosolanacearum]MDO3536294.1 UvrD-helicase domain-containing protein [Ralstonia pseudosolanacearum]MDO3606769.1 UvrD-helicase domain-containing protein [Ralstonia pseudosolanacearum]MDO3613396.1 UvrD-helicase domain-containing protein [Ralstonia pseudosolanacearum]
MEICALRQSLLDCQAHALVLGGPGSGKTSIALKKAVVRINSGLDPGQSVLFLSFSRAAVARLEEAMKHEVPKAHRNQLSMQTFHSFFWSLLSAHAYLLGVPTKLRILLPQDEQVEYGSIRSRDRNESNPAWRDWLARRERMFREEGRIAFDLFAPNAVELLTRSQHLRRLTTQRHPLIIVDEAQDTDANAWRCIEILAPTAQIICLADLEQQIFDYLPGIGPERVETIRRTLVPREIDLGGQNHRSRGTEIAIFGQDILLGRERGAPYRGVSSFRYDPRRRPQKTVLRIGLAMLQRSIRMATGQFGRSVAILTHSGASAAKISAALNTEPKPVRHKLAVDEAEVMLTARLAAFLLEPKNEGGRNEDLAVCLELLATSKAAAGLAVATQWRRWAGRVREGREPRAQFVQAVAGVIDAVRQASFTGDPARDWSFVKRLLRDSGEQELLTTAKNLDYLVAFNRGRRISGALGALWAQDGQYTNARDVLDLALAQDQILGGVDDPPGVQVMTIHKSKGKQFDGVIVVREGRHDGQRQVSSFVWWHDAPPYPRSRKILRVGVTRAKVHTLVLEPFFPACPIMAGHRL